MTGSLPAESGDFRRVLWTGLYSQLVLMTVPVDGDIGDEVNLPPLPTLSPHLLFSLLIRETLRSLTQRYRNTPSTKS